MIVLCLSVAVDYVICMYVFRKKVYKYSSYLVPIWQWGIMTLCKIFNYLLVYVLAHFHHMVERIRSGVPYITALLISSKFAIMNDPDKFIHFGKDVKCIKV